MHFCLEGCRALGFTERTHVPEVKGSSGLRLQNRRVSGFGGFRVWGFELSCLPVGGLGAS